MPYTTPDFATIRERMLRDARNLDPTAPADGDSDLFVRSSCVASAVEGLYDYQAWLARQLLPDTADTEYLEAHAGLRGIVRKVAVAASGTATFTGTPGVVLQSGASLKSAAGTLYQTTADGAVGDEGAVTVACAAVSAGAVSDLIGDTVTLMQPPTGIEAVGTATITGGADAESDASLLSRLLDYMQNPPGGGNAADYRRWAKSVAGVGEAYVYPLRQGAGTVDIVIAGDGVIASDEVVQAAQAYIDEQRPCTAKASTVIAAVALTVDVTLKILPATGYTLQTLTAPVREAVQATFADCQPGSHVYLSVLIAAVSAVPGVADVAVVLPVSTVVPTAIQWPRCGSVTLEAV